ncbi:GxGYxYP domain-containing protein [Gordoniibacillus kamchatkensis]|uniref:GxGYxYP domain-containing protein n=1 Tax=Gordoniibacillus kamchatkensis TaxID=1590651 RepID=UPI0006988257|nr:GxGYxYP domain-containing protein [Paenibacillus sp. VKM B-2647]
MFRKATKATVISMALACLLSLSSNALASSVSNDDAHSDSVVWPKHQQLPSFAKVKRLDVADIYDAPGDIKLLMATLQGIVNRKEPRIYLLENQEEGKTTWLNNLEVPYSIQSDYWSLLKQYIHEVKGIIIYDPNVQDSINVATTLAGLKDGIVASPELAEKLKVSPYNLKVLEDLRGKFKDRMDAYTWQYEHLWNQTTHRMLIGLSPNTSVKIPPGLPASFSVIAQETAQIRDASNRKIYDFDLSSLLGKEAVYVRFDDAFPQDGWAPPFTK